MSAKRVLLIGPFPPPIGGDTVLTLNLSKSNYWNENGIELVCVNTSAGDRVRFLDEKLTLGDYARGARVFFEILGKLPRCGAVLLWANNRFIVTEGLIIIACSRLFRKPIFVKVFGAYLSERIRRTPRLWGRFALSILGGAACVFPETKALARALVEEWRLPMERVVALPNFLPDSSLGRAFVPKQFGGKCVFFGQIKREKGVFDIIDAVGGSDKVSCDFFGPLLDRDREDFHRAVAGHRNIAYRGTVEPGAVIRTAAAYDVLLLPTYHQSEGYPAVILQAYAAGIPVIATNWLAIPEIVQEGVQGLLVPVRSPAKIREAIDNFFADGTLYESMGRNAYGFVKTLSESAVVNGILIPRLLQTIRGNT
jgi:glycosyltransferase involved in cell wall biosynthesis